MTVSQIATAVCREFRLPKRELLKPTRKESIAFPRQVAIALTYELSGMPMKRVIEAFRKRDINTIYCAMQRVRDRVETEAGIRASVERIKTALSA